LGGLGVLSPFFVVSFCILGDKKKKKRLKNSILSLISFENKNKLGKFSSHFNCDLVWGAVFGYSSSVWADF
jgi:hypothetical protein